jgi:hypothetical protein
MVGQLPNVVLTAEQILHKISNIGFAVHKNS